MLKVDFRGEEITLQDKQLEIGDKLPDARLFENNMTVFNVSDTSGIRVFLTIPSLDTPVCDSEVRVFNSKASELPNVSIYAVSVDLPFAQARWCGDAGVKAVKTLSDYNGAEFGRATGTYIADLALLTRAVFVVVSDDQVVYREYVPVVGNAPDYDAVYKCLEQMI
jgi:thiol peroxidase